MAKRGWKRKRKVAPKVDMTLEENMFRYVIPENEDTPITNQKQEGTCQKWATADMASIVLRREFPCLVTSPQILIDRNPDLRGLIAYCVDEDKGLESVNDYPVIRIARNLAKEDEIRIQTSKRERFRIQELVYCSDLNEIIARILGMFCDGGYRYPCVCVMQLGELSDPDVARRHALGSLPPYRHSRHVPRNNKKASKSHGVQHAMLITSVDTTSEDANEHYCVVKNTYGTSWGDGGRSRVGFEVFDYVIFPVHKEKEEREKEEMEKEVRKKRKIEKKVEERPEGGDDGGYAKSCKKRMEEKLEGVDNGGFDGGARVLRRDRKRNPIVAMMVEMLVAIGVLRRERNRKIKRNPGVSVVAGVRYWGCWRGYNFPNDEELTLHCLKNLTFKGSSRRYLKGKTRFGFWRLLSC